MRQQDHSGLLGEMRSRKVADVLRQLTGLQRLQDRGVVDHPATGEVEYDRTGSHLCDAAGIDHPAGRIDERYVQREEVAVLENLAQAVRLLDRRRQAPRRIHGDVRVVPDHMHAELDRRIGNQATDLAEAHNPERVPPARTPRTPSCRPRPFSSSGSSGSSESRYFNAPSMLRAASNMPATELFTALALAPGALNTGIARRHLRDRDVVGAGPGAADRQQRLRNSRSCRSAERTRMACGSSTSADTANRSQGSLFSPRPRCG